MIFSGPFDTFDNIGHATTAVASKDLDSLHLGVLGNTKFLACNGTRAVSSVAVAVLVGITLWNCLAPMSSALEVDMVNIGTGVDNVGSDVITTIG